MIVSLRRFKTKDLQVYEDWRVEIDANQYMSRFCPRAFNGKDVTDTGLYEWYVIMVDGEDVGTVWLEKNGLQDPVATLGILIGKRVRLGTGIGRKVIPLAIEQAHKVLSFEAVQLNVRKANARAIGCYKHCGFQVVDQGSKVGTDGEKIEYLKMELSFFSPAPSVY
jgi:RimJ/RimL family protein N-acetyltransferase